MINILSENWHKYAPCLPAEQADARHFVTMWHSLQRNKFRCYRTIRAYGSVDSMKEKIFQPFITTNPTGTGLGLSLSYDIVKAHGGEIAVHSKKGKGTEFIIKLPLA